MNQLFITENAEEMQMKKVVSVGTQAERAVLCAEESNKELKFSDTFDTTYNTIESADTSYVASTDYGTVNIDKCPDPDDKFVMYWSQLEPLLQSCITCGNRSTMGKSWVRGSMLKVKITCNLGHTHVWSSQPYIGNMASGNLILSSCILLTRNSFTHESKFFDLAKTLFVSSSTFFEIQKTLLFPVIDDFYKTHSLKLKDEIKQLGSAVDLVGRVDVTRQGLMLSMGHIH